MRIDEEKLQRRDFILDLHNRFEEAYGDDLGVQTLIACNILANFLMNSKHPMKSYGIVCVEINRMLTTGLEAMERGIPSGEFM